MTRKQMASLTGIELLRQIVGNLNFCRESFLDRFDPEQTVKIGRAHLLAEYDIFPDEWTEAQVQEALAGKVPRWNESGEPIAASEGEG